MTDNEIINLVIGKRIPNYSNLNCENCTLEQAIDLINITPSYFLDLPQKLKENNDVLMTIYNNVMEQRNNMFEYGLDYGIPPKEYDETLKQNFKKGILTFEIFKEKTDFPINKIVWYFLIENKEFKDDLVKYNIDYSSVENDDFFDFKSLMRELEMKKSLDMNNKDVSNKKIKM